jgi:hypothetical protein
VRENGCLQKDEHYFLTSGVVFNVCTARILDDTNLVGNIDGLVIRGETDESLLLTIGTDESVNLDGLDVVHLLNGILDLVLVGVNVDDEDEGVVGLNLSHGSLSGQGVTEDGVLIQTGTAGDGSTGVRRLTGQGEGVGTTEAGGVEHTARTSREVTLQSSLLGGLSADSLRGSRCLLGGVDLLGSRRSLSLFGHLFLFLSITSQYTSNQGSETLFLMTNSNIHSLHLQSHYYDLLP